MHTRLLAFCCLLTLLSCCPRCIYGTINFSVSLLLLCHRPVLMLCLALPQHFPLDLVLLVCLLSHVYRLNLISDLQGPTLAKQKRQQINDLRDNGHL